MLGQIRENRVVAVVGNFRAHPDHFFDGPRPLLLPLPQRNSLFGRMASGAILHRSVFSRTGRNIRPQKPRTNDHQHNGPHHHPNFIPFMPCGAGYSAGSRLPGGSLPYSRGSKYPNAYKVPSWVPTKTLLAPEEIPVVE